MASPLERIEAWTVSQAADALADVSILPASSRTARQSTVTIEIPLDQRGVDANPSRRRADAVHTVYKRQEPVRRDSLKRREALLKGKEGSRRRQRWENDRLLNNPWAQVPEKHDFQPLPTYPRHTVPYFLAPLWDAELKGKVQERQARADAANGPANPQAARAVEVLQELRPRLKKSRGAKNLLRDLEHEVRSFVEQWECKQRELELEGLINATDSEDDEIVFVGRNTSMSDDRRHQCLAKDRLIFESLVDDHGAAFGRYLVHSISTYYGLQSWSVTRGNPARREAYVGMPRHPPWSTNELPPLWTKV